jgi:hypothetical protein
MEKMERRQFGVLNYELKKIVHCRKYDNKKMLIKKKIQKNSWYFRFQNVKNQQGRSLRASRRNGVRQQRQEPKIHRIS